MFKRAALTLIAGLSLAASVHAAGDPHGYAVPTGGNYAMTPHMLRAPDLYMAIGYMPPAVAAYTSPDGGTTWAPGTGGAGTPLGYIPPAVALYCLPSGTTWLPCTGLGGGGGGGGTGTVTNFSAAGISNLFSTTVANASSTPALTFTLASQAAGTFFAAPAGGGAPVFRPISSADISGLMAAFGLNPDSTKNGAVNLTYTGIAPTAPGSNTVQQTQATAVTTPYTWSMPGAPPPDASHTMLSFTLNNGVWQGAWVTAGGAASVSQIDYWPMSDTSGTDSVGGNTLTYTGATATTDASLGNVLTFSGASASGGLSTSTTLTNFTNTTAFKVAAWIKPSSMTGSDVATTINNTDSTYKGWGFIMGSNGALTVQLISNASNSNAMNCSSATGLITANTLAHVGFSVDGTQSSSSVKIYVNGQAVTTTCSGTLSATIANGNKLGIGKTVDGQNLFPGVIARVHVDSGSDGSSFATYYSGKN